jgi:filamentous hemagglutinin family protein
MMERVRKSLRGRNWRKAVVYFLTCCLILNTSLPAVLAAPTGGAFTVGTGSITQPGTATNVVVDQLQSVIQWTSLDTLGGAPEVRESLNFSQGGLVDAAVLNRVSGAATQFNGDLTAAAGMRIFVINPAGIIFGGGSTVNVTQLVASGLNMSNGNFLNATGDPTQDFVFAEGDGNVQNDGTIIADSAYLIGKKAINNGAIVVGSGLIVMAAGDSMYLAQDGSNVVVEVPDVDPGGDPVDVYNTSLMSARNGTIVLAAGDAFSRAVTNVGVIDASGGFALDESGGEITAHAARIENRGTIIADGDGTGDGGIISLTATEEVALLDNPLPDVPGVTTANADDGGTGNGGTITLTSDDMVTIGEDTLVEARGGDDSGDGGLVKITSEHFVIAGDIDASPGNTDYEPGALEIDPATVTIANGTNAGELDTLYEEDIEAMSGTGTNVVVYADDSITVQDINDGEITGRFGGVELYATGPDSLVSFDDVSDTIRTTLGDIVIEAGGGGITAGNLITAKDSSDIKPTPGQILLTTDNGGDITTGNMLIEDGWGHALIDVEASGDLTVNGSVIVGSESDILNVPNGDDAQAMVYLSAGDHVTLNGEGEVGVGAYAHGRRPEIADTTVAEIRIFAGTNMNTTGDAYINGNLVADAQASSNGVSEATIEVDAWGEIVFAPLITAHAIADNGGENGAEVEGTESDEDTSPQGDIAQIIINAQHYPPPPPIGINDDPSTPKDAVDVFIDVLDNDTQGDEPLEGGAIADYTDLGPGEGTLTPILDGEDRIIGFEYDPPEDLSTLTFDENGEVEVTFTYWVEDADGVVSGDPTTVIITLVNDIPQVVADSGTTPKTDPVDLADVVGNDLDDDTVDSLTVVPDSFPATAANGGTVTPIYDGDDIVGFTYTPGDLSGLGFNDDGEATDSFAYAVTDSFNNSEPGTVTITLTNGLPDAGNDTATTDPGAAVVIPVLANDSDPDGDPFTVGSFNYEGAGTLVLNEDGTFTYTPADGFDGQDSFTYSATDGFNSSPATATITVNAPAVPAVPPLTPAPGLERIELQVSGCPALMTWAAAELGVDERMMDVWVANALASTRDIQPCDSSSRLRTAATILQDAGGTHIAALAQVINEFASSTAPPTEEQMASIANAMARNTEDENVYATAGEYLDALAEYVGILNLELGLSAEESVELATANYVGRLAESENVGVAAYVAVQLSTLAE